MLGNVGLGRATGPYFVCERDISPRIPCERDISPFVMNITPGEF